MELDVIGSEKDEMLRCGYQEDEITNLSLLVYKTFTKALSGDVKAIKYIFSVLSDDFDIFPSFKF